MADNFPNNFGLGVAPQVWLFSDFDGYNQIRPIAYPAYLTFTQQARLERLRQARLLHDGRHWRLFVFEERTQFDFPKVMTQGRERPLFVPYNILRLVSKTSANLLFGAQPEIKVENLIQSRKMGELVERTALHRLLYTLSIECSCDGEAYVEAVIENGAVYLRRVDAADIFPQGKIQPDGQYKSYCKYNAQNVGSDDKPDWRLLITTYLPGKITRVVKALDQQGFVMPKVLTLNEWPQVDPEEGPIEPETITGILRNTITYVPNMLIRDLCVSDYDGLVEQQDKLNAKETQIARVLARHADPKLAMPESAATTDGNVRSDYQVYYFRDKEQIPQYLTWNAELASAMEERNQTRSALLLMSETPPLLLGLKEGAVSSHNAYKSVRIEATAGLTKAQAKALIWKPAIQRMLTVAQDLEQTLPGERYDRTPVGLEMNDGLPIDTDAQSNEIATLRGCGVMSVERGVELQISDAAGRAKELARLEAEKAAATPSILIAPPAKPGDAGGGDIAPSEDASSDTGDDVEIAA